MTAKQIIFSGKVQGVGFRYQTKDIALGFDVVGWVKNLGDGTVELQVMGEEDEVGDFISEITEESELAPLIKEYHSFDIPELSHCRGFRIVS
jgi:acylphosphatase